MSGDVFLSIKDVTAKTTLSRSSIYLHISKGMFPPPLKLGGGRRAVWLESDITRWLDKAISARGEWK